MSPSPPDRVSRDRPPWRRPLREVNTEPAHWVYRHLVLRLVRIVMPLVARRHWSGQENLPREGGVLIIANHISNFDPLVLGECLITSGRWPRFLGKSEIFKAPVLGWVARKCEQIPVYRNTDRARDSLIHARRALERGHAVTIYPEGTITSDPDAWPMTGRRGAAQLALETGVTVIPVAQTGANEILGQKELEWSRLFGKRRDVHVHIGTPIDLAHFAARLPDDEEPSKELLDSVTNHFLDTLTAMVAELRQEPPPVGRWDTRAGRRVDSSTH